MIDLILKPYLPLRYVCDPSKAGPPLTPLEVHQKRLVRQGQRALSAEEIARIYPEEVK